MNRFRPPLSYLKPLRWVLALCFLAIVFTLALQADFRSHFLEAFIALWGWPLGISFFLMAVIRTAQAQSLKVSTSLFSTQIGFSSALNLTAVKGALNLAFSGFGLAAQTAQARALYLVPIRVVIYSNIVQSVFMSLSLGISLSLATLFLSSEFTSSTHHLLLVLGAATTLASAGLIVGAVLIEGLNRHTQAKPELYWIFSPPTMSGAKISTLLILLTLQTSIIVIRTGRLLLIAWAISPATNLDSLTVAVLSADLISLVPLTPGGLGLRELAIAFAGNLIESYNLFLAAALIDRIIVVTFNLLHGGLAIWRSPRHHITNP